MKIFTLIGKIVGYMSLIVPRYLSYPWYIIKRAFITTRLKGGFKQFGRNTLLAPEVKVYSPQFISIGDYSSIMSHCVIETVKVDNATPELVIGNNVSIGEYSHITCSSRVTIDSGVLTGRFVLITDNGHGKSDKHTLDVPPLAREIYSKGPVHIGENVWIGDKVTILPNVTIGKGCIIAANAVVTQDIPDYSVVAGVPAKIIKTIK